MVHGLQSPDVKKPSLNAVTTSFFRSGQILWERVCHFRQDNQRKNSGLQNQSMKKSGPTANIRATCAIDISVSTYSFGLRMDGENS